MSFDPLTDNEPAALSSAITASRQKRQYVEQAINAARRADWAAAAELNQKVLEMGPDSAAQNRLAKAYWELGELAQAREHYQSALAIDPTNRIAERNIGRLRQLMVEAGSRTVAATPGSKAPVSIFVEETGKTGFAYLVDLARPSDLAQVNPGDYVELEPVGPRVGARSNGVHIGSVEPRVAARLLRLMADGNKYAAGVTSLGDKDVRIIIRETYRTQRTTARSRSRPQPRSPTSAPTPRAPWSARRPTWRKSSSSTKRTDPSMTSAPSCRSRAKLRRASRSRATGCRRTRTTTPLRTGIWARTTRDSRKTERPSARCSSRRMAGRCGTTAPTGSAGGFSGCRVRRPPIDWAVTMADQQKRSTTPAGGLLLPALERIAPVPDLAALGTQIGAHTKAGDVVLELHGRGGWVTRSAIDQLRRAFTIETSALSRLVAEIVLRPPDLRHLDAAVSAIAVDARGTEGSLRSAIEDSYASRCHSCGGPVIVDEFIWDAEATEPARKSFRCPRCRDGRAEGRLVAVDADDLYRSRSVDAAAVREALRERFPTPDTGQRLPDALVDLYPPRAQVALAAILERIETELRAPSVQAALRLAVVHMVQPISRLNGYPGRMAAVRISAGQVRGSTSRQWRERNAWTVFEEGTRIVRAFVQSLETSGRRTPARVGPDLRALQEGSANVALRFGMPLGRETFGPPPRPGAQPGARPRVSPGIRLVLSQLPIHWSADSLSFAYLATSLAVGPEGAATLPLASIFEPSPRSEWARDATTVQRALSAVQPVLLPDAQTVLLLEGAPPEALVAAVIGAVGAGLRFDDAVLAGSERGIDGTVRFAMPRSAVSGDREVAIQSTSRRAGPFQISVVEAAIADIAVAVMQLRGEPTRFDRILGEVLLGLDHLGHLRRLVGTPRSAEIVAEDAQEVRPPGLLGVVSDLPGPAAARPRGRSAAGTEADEAEGAAPARAAALIPGPGSAPPGPPWLETTPASDPVRLTLDLIRKELRRPDHPRLREVEEEIWWLREERDLVAAKTPLSERLEWGIFSLLSTGGGISRASFDERIGHLFRGPETADAELIQTCLESYRSADPSPDGLIRTEESLPRRYAEHGEIVGLLTDFAHRLGMRAWITRREQRRSYQGRPLADMLSDPERRVYLPLLAPGPQELLEEIDCIWYVRGRGAFLFDVEWMAVLDGPVLRRGPRIETSDRLVRFLVVPDERAALIRLRLQRSPVLRARLQEDNWHILTWSNVRRLHLTRRASLSALGPLLGLDPLVERDDDQMAMFGK